MNPLQTAARAMRNGLEEVAALLVGQRAESLREDTAAPGVGIPMPRRLPLKRPLLHGRKGMAPWQKIGPGRERR
ncbi:hypothetical protein [Stenotrophomonas sp. TWI1183]|uniref:hypothetical protein n=1 Tax=Stenotrophomonas sp. TWI1183 TaxID=3136799 RepID=UPI00320A75D7